MKPGELVDLDRRHHFPGDGCAINSAFGQGVGDTRQRHAHRRGAQIAQHLGDLARGAAHFQAFEVGCRPDLLVFGVEHARTMHMQRQHLCVLELIGGHGLHILPIGPGGRLGIGHHEGQLKHFHPREAAGRVARKRPDNIHHAVFGLVIELHGGAAQLHGRVGFKLDASAGLFFNLVHPDFVHVQPDVGQRCHEGMKLERDGLLRQAAQGRRSKCYSSGGFEECASLNHGTLKVSRKVSGDIFNKPQRDAGEEQQQQRAKHITD